ncbi:hypothetical protein [Paenibacillus spongiae]|uniref:Uncharacterized protein n=1 Tax=Paenibacillus spongiae TaxID=2909671 RepID=A0ABY5SH54_9BACL|nr:hypothetical protein [Paenibacillus spongiae]UVI33317.1 hypothetical protein L1F29_16370 [Paenibacillus spongiae]
MASFGLMILTVLILLVMIFFHAAVFLDFFRPSVLQVQLLGVHVTLLGVLIVLAFDEFSGFGFTIGLAGLITGLIGSFREPNETKSNHS